MTAVQWREEDGLCTVDADTLLHTLLAEGMVRQVHLGTLSASHSTVREALQSASPVLARRLVQATIRGHEGEWSGPLSPRAASGPDLACFVLGLDSPVHLVTFCVNRVEAWGQRASLAVTDGIALARKLGERGCTLVEVRALSREAVSVTAALPRRSLLSLIPMVEPPSVQTEMACLAWRVTWLEVEGLWRTLAGDPRVQGTLVVHALDHNLASVEVVRRGTDPPWEGDLAMQLKRELLGADSSINRDLLHALSLRSHDQTAG